MGQLPDWLILSVWRSLLGEIYPSIRAIAIELSEQRALRIFYYLDREPEEEDYESIEVLATNISAAVGADQISSIDVACEYSQLRFKDLERYDGFVYCRREY